MKVTKNLTQDRRLWAENKTRNQRNKKREVLTAVRMLMLLSIPEDEGSMFLQNVGMCLTSPPGFITQMTVNNLNYEDTSDIFDVLFITEKLLRLRDA
jgi:hypothetical protein